MKYPKTDDQLRGEIIANGGLEAVHDLESEHSRHTIGDRQAYRAGLEQLAERYGVDRTEQLPSPARAQVLPYGPA